MGSKEKHPSLLAGRAKWFRHSAYEIVTRNGNDYVRPKPGSKLEIYRPLESSSGILLAYLNLAQSIEHLPNPKELTGPAFDERLRRVKRHNAEAVVLFFNRYGPLGILWESVKWFDEYRNLVGVGPTIYDFVLFDSRDGKGAIHFDRYIGRFICDRKASPTISECEGYSDSFLGRYSEPIVAILRDAQEMLFYADRWEAYRSGEHSPDAETAEGFTWREILSGLAAPNVTLSLDLDPTHTQIDYLFRSLASALRMMLVLHAVSQDQKLRKCGECGKYFFAKDVRSLYCKRPCKGYAPRKRRERSRANPKGGRADG